MQINKKNLFISLGCGKSCYYSNTLYDGCLCRIDKNSFDVEYIAFPGEGLPNDFGFSGKIIEDGSSLYMLEKMGSIVVFDLMSKTSSIIYSGLKVLTEKDLSYTDFIYYDGKFYIFQKYSTELIIVNKSTSQVSSVELFENSNYAFDESALVPIPIFCSSYRVDDNVSLVAGDGKTIVTYNLQSGDILKEIISDEAFECSCATYYDDTLYLLSREGNVYYRNSNDVVRLLFTSESNIYLNYYDIVSTDRSLWLLPGVGTDIVQIDRPSGTFRRKYERSDETYTLLSDLQAKYTLYIDENDNYLFANPTTSEMLFIDKHTDELTFKIPMFNNRENYMNNIMGRDALLNESDFCLQDYLKYVIG